jgi:short-subunit dehydrogenase involved in D-alanine esterification of teichoic acids
MFLAKEENAEKTYTKLKKKYLALKVILNVAGVNLTKLMKSKSKQIGARVYYI